MVFVNEFLIERIKHFSVSINNDMQLLIHLSKTDLKRIWIYVLEISSTLLPAILLSARVFNDRNFNTLPLNNEHSLCFIFLKSLLTFSRTFLFRLSQVYDLSGTVTREPGFTRRSGKILGTFLRQHHFHCYHPRLSTCSLISLRPS